MTKQEMVQLFQALNTMGTKKGVKFAYGVSRNLAIMKPEIEAIEKAGNPTEEFKKVDELRVAIAEKYAKKDEAGKPITADNAYVMENTEEMEKEFAVLKEENKEVFEARETQVKEYLELLKTDSVFVPHKILLSDVPSDISVQEMYSISPIIAEEIPSPFNG